MSTTVDERDAMAKLARIRLKLRDYLRFHTAEKRGQTPQIFVN